MTEQRPTRVGYILTDGFALLSTAAAIEPLRAANLIAQKTLYDIKFLATDSSNPISSSGSAFETVPYFEAGFEFDFVFVVAGGDPFAFQNPLFERYLRTLAARGVKLGGISGGAIILAKSGVMKNRRFTAHWHHIPTLLEHDPNLLIERSLFVVDRDRYTCAGGVAPLDMLHTIISLDHGAGLAREVNDWLIHTHIRVADEPQRASVAIQYGVSHPALISAIEIMSSQVANPLSLTQIAQLAGIGERQLQRLFTEQLDVTMMHFYRELRLRTADDLLRNSPLSILDISLMVGFESASYFSRVFYQKYGVSPKIQRQRAR